MPPLQSQLNFGNEYQKGADGIVYKGIGPVFDTVAVFKPKYIKAPC